MDEGASAGTQKKAGEEGRVICYVDETAFSLAPSVCSSYAPRGKTPVIRQGGLHGGVQVMSLISEHGGLYYHSKEGAFTGTDVVAFLEALLWRYRRYKLLIIWDGASIHRCSAVREYLQELGHDRLYLECLPAYSPQLNAAEQTHGYVKSRLLSNRLFKKVNDLHEAVVIAYEKLKEASSIVRRFFHHHEVAFHHT